MYSAGASEEITGRLLAKMFAHRDDYVLATKVYYPTGPGPNDQGLSRKHLLSAIDASLRRLGTDYVDLYQLHRFDSCTPVEETVQALDDLVRAGKVRYVGASAMYAWQFAKLQHCARANGSAEFVSMQNRYNLVNREDERELIPMCLDMGVGMLPYGPLARGLLAGTRERSGERHTTRATTATDPRTSTSKTLCATWRGGSASRQLASRWRGFSISQGSVGRSSVPPRAATSKTPSLRST
jgi:aryl-alcohol dehydrogenase-like predicted oxidoreductase